MDSQSSNIADIDLPALRPDVQLRPTQNAKFPWVIVDPVQEKQLGLDPIGHVVVSALAEPRTALQVLGMAHAQGEDRLDPVLLRKHIRHLARHGMLSGARAAMIASSALPADTADEELGPEALAALPFDFTDGLQHACQACGSCCSATDVGPIPPEVAKDVLEHDWRGTIPGLERNEDLFQERAHAGQTALLASMRNDQCVFLNEDKLCLIHKELGVARKPTPCRQFPFVFARDGDRIAVSLQMECRAYWQARQAARPMAEEEEDLRALLRIGSRVHAVPARVVVDSGLVVSRDRYRALEQAIITRVRSSDPALGPLGPLAAFAQGARAALAELYASVDAEERPYVGLGAWRRTFSGAFDGDPDPWENFFANLRRFADEASSFASDGAEVAQERQLPWLAQRLRMLARCIDALAGGVEPMSFRFRDAVATRTVLEDLIISALFAKEPIRRGSTVRFGLAMIGLRAMLTLAGACNRAKEACRVEVHAQDLIDTMVTISKMLRERAVLDLCQSLEISMISLFLTNLEVFARAAEPRLESPGGIR